MDNAVIGWFVGAAQALVGHPFDTWKLLIHTKKSTSVPKRKFLNGIVIPILTNGLVNASFFVVERHMHDNYSLNHFQAGAVSGAVTSLFLCPIENLKINKQLEYQRTIKPYRGLSVLAAREVPAIGIYFGLYNYLTETHKLDPLYAGGITGWVSWLTYPLDVVKNRVQSDYNITFRQAFAQGKLMKGFGVCSARAIIVNSVGFWTYDFVSKLIKI